MRSLSLGFGDELQSSRKAKRRYRMWELGTYYSEWQIVDGAGMLLSKDSSKDLVELDTRLSLINLGKFTSIRQLSSSAIELILDNGVSVHFLGNVRVDDEYFHAFFPNNQYVEFSKFGWKNDRSDLPWSRQVTH
jgi:hypothetical protein